MTVEYAHEKFMLAVYGMAQSAGSIQERVADAFVGHIMHVRDEDDLPGDLRRIASQLRQYREAWDRFPGDGRIAKWADSLTTDEAVEVARWIVQADDQLCVATA